MIVGFTYFGISNAEPTHYCLSREIKANCLDFSSTGKTCYTQPAKTGGKRCDVPWEEIPFIPSEISSETTSYSIGSKNVHCTKEGCF